MAANNTVPPEVHNQSLLQREIRSMFSTLTGNLTSLNRPGAGSGEESQLEDGGGGVGIITLAGSNKGTVMEGSEMGDSHGVICGDDGQLSAFANSNYQAVNNSVMMGGSCTAEDPGVHLVISDYAGDDDDGASDRENTVRDTGVEKQKTTTGQEEKEPAKDEPPAVNDGGVTEGRE